MKLSDRIRAGVEVAPWVIEEVKTIEREVSQWHGACLAGDRIAQEERIQSRIKIKRILELWFKDADPLETEYAEAYRVFLNLKEEKNELGNDSSGV